MPGETSFHYRRQSRVLAVQVLYERDISGHPVKSSVSWLLDETEIPEASAEYTLELVEEIVKRLDEIDGLIHRYAPMWPVKQLPVVDRNILRLAVLELRSSHAIPSRVVINEAVELAKTFGGESSPKFVNGVLGSVVEEMGKASQISSEPILAAVDNFSQEGN